MGAVQSLSGPLTLALRFPGPWFQLEAGLHYNWHRHYDPSLGRYTQADPLGFVDGPSVYGYARGRPFIYVDPNGRAIVFIGGGGVFSSGAGGDISGGAGIDLTTGQGNGFVTAGPTTGIGAGIDGGLGFFTGGWCDFQGDSFNISLQLLYLNITIFVQKGPKRNWGLYLGGGPPSLSITASPQQRTWLYNSCSCRGGK